MALTYTDGLTAQLPAGRPPPEVRRGIPLIIHDQEVSAVQVLGTLRVKCKNGRDIALRPSAERLVALLAVLGPHARTDAALILWPDMPRERALSNLRTVLWRARQDASGLVIEQGDDCRLGRVSVDLEDVLSWARQPSGAPKCHLRSRLRASCCRAGARSG